jgi:hypothetical protein
VPDRLLLSQNIIPAANIAANLRDDSAVGLEGEASFGLAGRYTTNGVMHTDRLRRLVTYEFATAMGVAPDD